MKSENVDLKIRQFINDYNSLIEGNENPDLRILEHNFEIFVKNQYLIRKEQNMAQDFLDELFQAFSPVGANPTTYVVMLNSLINIDIGFKSPKANACVVHLLNTVKFSYTLCSELFWSNLGKILLWLKRIVPKQVNVFLVQLKNFITEYKPNNDPASAISVFKALIIFFKDFPNYISTLIPEQTILQVFQIGFNLHNQPLNEAIEALKYGLNTFKNNDSELSYKFPIKKLCNESLAKETYTEGFCLAMQTILDSDIKNVKYLKFKSVPLNLLTTKDISTKLIGFQILPICSTCSPQLFTEEINVSILKAYEPQIKKRAQNRNDALLSLGNYLFSLKRELSKAESKVLDKCFKNIDDPLDNEQIAYCYLAVISKKQDSFEKHIDEVLNCNLYYKVIEGLVKCKPDHPIHSDAFDRRVISKANTILLDTSSPPAAIINAFKCLEKIQVSADLYSVELVLQYSLHMTNKNMATKKEASKFVLWYQNQKPTIEIVQRVLAVISAESNNKQRQYLMKKLYKYPSDESIIPILKSLLHDLTPEIRLAALKYIAKLAHIKEASELLSDFLTEKVHDLENSKNIVKEHIECFLHVSHAAFSDPGKTYAPYTKQVLVPFSKFLINYLLKCTQPLFTAAISLLAQMLPLAPKFVNIDLLANQISNCLMIHSSQKRIDAACNLLQSALDNTDLKFSIYNEQKDLIIKIFDLSNAQTTEESRVKLLKLLSSIGALAPSIITNLQTRTQPDSEIQSLITPNIYLSKFTQANAIEALTTASVGVASLNLIDILTEESLTSLHSMSIEVLLKILSIQQLLKRNLISKEFESQILKHITNIITSGSKSTISVLIKNVTSLITIFGEQFNTLVPHFVDLICNNWTKLEQSFLARISNWMMLYYPDSYKPYLPRITSVFVKYIGNSDIKYVTTILDAVISFGSEMRFLDHILYPPLLNWISNHAKESIGEILGSFKDILINGGAEKFGAQILKTMISIVQINPSLQEKALLVIKVVGLDLGRQFLLFVPHIASVFNLHPKDEKARLLGYILWLEKGNGKEVPKSISNEMPERSKSTTTKSTMSKAIPKQIPTSPEKTNIEFPMPMPDFDEGQWNKWCDELFSLMVKNSSSRAIAQCETIIEKHSGMKDALYPLAFALFYFEYKRDNNIAIDEILASFFHCNGAPRNVVRHFLNVIELIEVLGDKIPIKTEIITEKAQSADRIAQALRSSEALFDLCDVSQTERLVLYNQQLGLPLAAHGVLRIAGQRGFSTNQGRLLESLGLWEDALELYSKEIKFTPNNEQLYKGKLNCLRALSKYSELENESNSPKFMIYKAAAEWRLNQKEQFLKTVKDSLHDDNSMDGLYYKALYYVIINEYDKAEEMIYQMRKLYTKIIFPMISENYERVYPNFAKVSFGAEIEEVIEYKKMKKQSESASIEERILAEEEMKRIVKTWNLRFSQISPDPDIMHESLCIMSLVLSTEELKEQWIKFLSSAIENGRYELATISLNSLHEDSDIQVMKSRLEWAKGNKEAAFKELPSDNKLSDIYLGKWNLELGNLNDAYSHISKIVKNQKASPEDWSLWSQINFKLFEETKENSYINDSLEALLTGLSLNPSDPLSFTLKILSILFRRGNTELYRSFQQNISSLPVSVWIEVLPQIIARSNSTDPDLSQLIQDLIYSIGSKQPHVVLYSLMVPLKSDASDRKKIASSIFDKLRTEYPIIVEQILILANELIRTAVSWWEKWNSTLDEASRAYITRKDNEEMIDLLLPCHELISKPPETFYETLFIRQFGQILSIAEAWIKKYRETKADECLYQAWSYYINVFHQLKPIITELSSISLKDASPLLYNFKNTQLNVPGTFKYNEPLINLTSVEPTMTIMKSKQRPRRMGLIGSDGQTYTFLLKANEDTRLDERVMQFFGLVNSLVSHSSMPLKSKLDITTYNVIPLTREVGLIGWVPECNTVYDLVKSYRERHGIVLEIEYQTTIKACPKFETLPFGTEKLNAFKKGLKVQQGNDLKHMILSLADDSNHWIKRRTAYTTSLAMTSMAGYILGLGDRHLCNIMIKKRSAKLVHIDFGDCFEVAMHREKFPEVVPFRLTRILQKALEVSRIEGTFRNCCQSVMDLFRKNGDTIYGLLEVFIYDPLRQWTETKEEDEQTEESSSAIAIMKRIQDKLQGKEIEPDKVLSVNEQVDYLIKQAASTENLCRMFRGWFPWW